MAATIYPTMRERNDQVVVDRASARGFVLVQCETEQGQLVWEWRHGADPRPRFVSRRVAVEWMSERLGLSPLPV
jgi:hypothetical protein